MHDDFLHFRLLSIGRHDPDVALRRATTLSDALGQHPCVVRLTLDVADETHLYLSVLAAEPARLARGLAGGSRVLAPCSARQLPSLTQPDQIALGGDVNVRRLEIADEKLRLLVPGGLQPRRLAWTDLVERLRDSGTRGTFQLEVRTLDAAQRVEHAPMLHALGSLVKLVVPDAVDLPEPYDPFGDVTAEIFDRPRRSAFGDDLVRVTLRLVCEDDRVVPILARALRPGFTTHSRADIAGEDWSVDGLVHRNNLHAVFQLPTADGPCDWIAVRAASILPRGPRVPDGIVLGEDLDGQITSLPAGHLDRHVYVVGETGCGKSTLLASMIASAIEREDRAVVVLDPHGDLSQHLLRWMPSRHADRCVYLDFANAAHSPALNVLEADCAASREFAIGELDHMFLQMYGPEIWGPRIQDVFRNLANLLSRDPEGPGSLIDLLWAVDLQDRSVADRFEKVARDAGADGVSLRLFMRQILSKRSGDGSVQELTAYYRSKFSPFVDNLYLRNILGQQRSTLDFGPLIAERKVVLLNLNSGVLSRRYARLLGRLLTLRLFQTAIRNGQLPAAQRPPAVLFLDEFQNFVSPAVEDILAEARKFRLGLVLANQYLGQVSAASYDVTQGRKDSLLEAVLGNVGTLVGFRVGAVDAQRLATEIGGIEPAHLSQLDNWCAVARTTSGGGPQSRFGLRTRPLDAGSGGAHTESIIRRSVATLCRPRAVIEREISSRVLTRLGIVDVPEDPVGAILNAM